MKPFEIDDALAQRITALSDDGDEDVEREQYDAAIEKYQAALAMVPEPVMAWRVTMWLLTAMGEAYLFKDDYESAQKVLSEAMLCPEGSANPFLHLRLGQAELALGNQRGARDELLRALLGGGEAVFEGEDPALLAMAKANLPEDFSG
jgi:tetratricopeptide (TPR) repeat protein